MNNSLNAYGAIVIDKEYRDDNCKSCTDKVKCLYWSSEWWEWCQNCCSWTKYDGNMDYADTVKRVGYFGYECSTRTGYQEIIGYNEWDECPDCGGYWLSDCQRWTQLHPEWHTIYGKREGEDYTHYYCGGHDVLAYNMQATGDHHVTRIDGQGDIRSGNYATVVAYFQEGYEFAYAKNETTGQIRYVNPSTWYMNRDQKVLIYSKARSYGQKVYVRYQNPDMTWGNYQCVINQNYSYGTNVNWTRPEDETYAKAEINYTVTGSSTRYIDVYRQKYELVLKGYCEETSMDDFSSYGTADVYINGQLMAKDCGTFSVTLAAGATYRIENIKSKIGFTYDGVIRGEITDSGITSQSVQGTVEGRTVLSLVFHRNQYKIHFDCMGGIEGPADVTLYYGEEYPLESSPTRTGYYFKNWNTKVDGTGEGVSAGGKIKNLTEADNTTVTLYAQWSQRSFQTVKISSSWHGGTFVRRRAGDEEWYDTVGKLDAHTPVPDAYIVQQWRIGTDGHIEQVR